jgi:hypothetical protein
VESRGPLALHIDGSAWHTHGSMVARDSLLGPLYLAYQEILEPFEPPVSSYLISITTVRLKVEENQLVDVFSEIGTRIEGLKGA